MSEIVSVRNLYKSYKNTKAVNDLSFAIPRGIIFGLLGPNGAGKTTTISMLSGLFPPDKGTISIGGYDICREPGPAKALMGVVPQDIALYYPLSARENLHFWGKLYGLRGAALKARTEEVLELVGLRERANEPVRGYSGGMKRRINIAVGLLHNPQLLLLDEPTVGIDPQSRRAILETVKRLNTAGMTVLYTSHYMEEVAELCSLVAVMDHGRIIAQGTQAELHQLVGDNDLIRLAIDQENADVSFLSELPAVNGISAEAGSIDITLCNGNARLAEIITLLVDRGIQVTSARVEQPNLEAVFLHLTGRTLRD